MKAQLDRIERKLDAMIAPVFPTVNEQEINDSWGVSDKSAREIVNDHKGKVIVE